MRTEYVFTVDGAELVYIRQAVGTTVLTVNHKDEYGEQQLCSCFVDEGDLAERQFFNHFGDDSSWPEGWWPRMTEGMFTKLSWARENYAPPKVRTFARDRSNPAWRRYQPAWKET